MAIQLKISPRILPNISSLYNEPTRVILEYIDNSIDSAEQFLEREANRYSRQISIQIETHGNSDKEGKIIIRDNCTGINNFTKVVENVGDSDKKAQAWTNGQFGYGIYSFMAICAKLEITSKLEHSDALYIPIIKEQFNVKSTDEVLFPDPIVIVNFPTTSGTIIQLSRFNKFMWREIDLGVLKSEIEKHFEQLLGRENLDISLMDKEGSITRCESFNYDLYEGDCYEDTLTCLKHERGYKYKVKEYLNLVDPIKVYIKVTKGRAINKYPAFIAKGRRIGEIKDIRSFRSKNKSTLWGHPNVTGYIDVGSYLEPTIARNDFRNTQQSRILFETIIELEPLILEVVNKANEESEQRHYRELEDKLNQALSKLAKLDAMKFRTEYLTGKDVNLAPGAAGQQFGNGTGSKDRGDGTANGSDPLGGEIEGEQKGILPEGGDIPGGETGDGPSNKEASNPFEDTGYKGGEKKRSGFNVKIIDDDLQIDEATDKPIRSQLIADQIRIYKKHEDFLSRVEESRKKEKRITERLITYLAGEITVHYKDKLHCRKGQPAYNKQLFIELVEFVYQLEELLKDLAGKNLSDVS